MPEKDGLAALKEIIELDPSARVIMFSALVRSPRCSSRSSSAPATSSSSRSSPNACSRRWQGPGLAELVAAGHLDHLAGDPRRSSRGGRRWPCRCRRSPPAGPGSSRPTIGGMNSGNLSNPPSPRFVRVGPGDTAFTRMRRELLRQVAREHVHAALHRRVGGVAGRGDAAARRAAADVHDRAAVVEERQERLGEEERTLEQRAVVALVGLVRGLGERARAADAGVVDEVVEGVALPVLLQRGPDAIGERREGGRCRRRRAASETWSAGLRWYVVITPKPRSASS